MSLHRVDRRTDRNQTEIVKALRRVGALVWIIASPCDLLVGFLGRFLTMEVKDGAKPPSARRLTKAEVEYELLCRAARLPHYIVTNVEEALEALTATVRPALVSDLVSTPILE